MDLIYDYPLLQPPLEGFWLTAKPHHPYVVPLLFSFYLCISFVSPMPFASSVVPEPHRLLAIEEMNL